MKRSRIFLLPVLVAAFVILSYRLTNGIETDILALANLPQGNALRELSTVLATRGRILVSAPQGTDVTPLASTLTHILNPASTNSFAETIRFLGAHRAGLLAPETRAKLLAGDTTTVVQQAQAQLYGFTPPLISVKDDPFLLVTDFITSLQRTLAPGWVLRNGFPVRDFEGRSYALIAVDLTPQMAASFLQRVQAFNAGGTDFGLTSGAYQIQCAGPPFHTAHTTAHANTEINTLSLISLALIVLFGYRLMGTLRFIPSLLLALFVSSVMATAVLFTFFPHPHILSFVFGTSLLGLSVDYFYHARVAGDVRRVLRPMSLSLLTTVLSFTPLLLASVPVLRQMATFTVAGLITVWAWMALSNPRIPQSQEESETITSTAHPVIALVLALITGMGLVRLHIVYTPDAFYTPSSILAAAEKRCAQLAPTQTGRYVYVQGNTIQESLEREERAHLNGLSTFIPSYARQRENRDLIAHLYAKAGPAFTAQTGIPVPSIPSPSSFLNPDEITDPRLAALITLVRLPHGTLAPCPDNFVVPDSSYVILNPRQTLTDVFHTFTRETCHLLMISVLGLIAVLILIFRTRVLHYILPLLATLLATAGTLGWLHIPLTFFTLLCFFVLAGLGFDYIVFQANTSLVQSTQRTVWYSFLTSLTGLGALSFTNFSITRDMGLTFACGLTYAYLFARLLRSSSSSASTWYAQAEQSAGSIRLKLMWLMYRFFGKNVVKAFCIPVVICIYPFARTARLALKQYYGVLAANGVHVSNSSWTRFRHILFFAWSLVDKTDAFTRATHLPHVILREDTAARHFNALIAAHQGVFLIISHLGTAEMFSALPLSKGQNRPPVHAFQQMSHSSRFTQMLMRHFAAHNITLHPTETIGVETASEMRAALTQGALVLMAGDRESAGSKRTWKHDFLGQSCVWPKGVFTFAQLMECPVFFMTCIPTSPSTYELHLAESTKPNTRENLLDSYVKFLETETKAHPYCWHNFYNFFRSSCR